MTGLRALFEASPYEVGRRPIQVTCSFGVATIGADVPHFDAQVEAADRALYRAKNEGRNRVETEPAAPPSTAPGAE